MVNFDYTKTLKQVAILNELLPIYGGKTLDNVVQRLEARLLEAKEQFLEHNGHLLPDIIPEEYRYKLLDENDIE